MRPPCYWATVFHWEPPPQKRCKEQRRARPAQGTGQRRRAGRTQAQVPAVKKLSRTEFDALLKDAGGVLLLDVRRPDELQSVGGFPAYLSIQAADVEKYLAFIPKDRAIVTVSNHANRAQRAAAVLKKNGFNVVGAIGAEDYEGEGGTLVKISPSTKRRGRHGRRCQAPASLTCGLRAKASPASLRRAMHELHIANARV